MASAAPCLEHVAEPDMEHPDRQRSHLVVGQQPRFHHRQQRTGQVGQPLQLPLQPLHTRAARDREALRALGRQRPVVHGRLPARGQGRQLAPAPDRPCAHQPGGWNRVPSRVGSGHGGCGRVLARAEDDRGERQAHRQNLLGRPPGNRQYRRKRVVLRPELRFGFPQRIQRLRAVSTGQQGQTHQQAQVPLLHPGAVLERRRSRGQGFMEPYRECSGTPGGQCRQAL